MTTALLLGTTTSGSSNGGSPNRISGTQFIALATGKISEFEIQVVVNCNVKCALYSDSGDSPNTLLGGVDTGQACNAGWNTMSFPETSIVAGTKYWLLAISDVSSGNWIKYGYDTGHHYGGKDQTYAGYNWDTTMSGFTVNHDLYHCLAGWGILVLSPSVIIQPVSYGSPIVSVLGNIINPQGISIIVSCSTPSLFYLQTISPSNVIQPVAIGTPWVGVLGFVKPQSTIQQILVGRPTILKYVWHVILDGQYATETPHVNLAYIIGRDAGGNLVYGAAVDSIELGLVGERLDFQQELAIPTDSQAASMASAILSKMRLTKASGIILIPPNCGQELFDVVQISDSLANQPAVKFRVVCIKLVFNQIAGTYYQIFKLVNT